MVSTANVPTKLEPRLVNLVISRGKRESSSSRVVLPVCLRRRAQPTGMSSRPTMNSSGSAM